MEKYLPTLLAALGFIVIILTIKRWFEKK